MLKEDNEHINIKEIKDKIEAKKIKTNLDADGDGYIHINSINEYLEILGEKNTEEKVDTLLKNLNYDEETKLIDINEFFEKLPMVLELYGSDVELIEAFRVFDKEKTGKIPINKFRYIMKNYANVNDDLMDEMIFDALEMKKKQVLDSSTNIEYEGFIKRLFE